MSWKQPREPQVLQPQCRSRFRPIVEIKVAPKSVTLFCGWFAEASRLYKSARWAQPYDRYPTMVASLPD